MKKLYALFILSLITHFTFAQAYHSLATESFIQKWTNTAQITTNDNWSSVASIQGFLGQDITTATGINPQTLTAVSSVANDLDVIANQSNTGITNGGVAEFDGLVDPTIALQGSGTADAPHLIVYLNTTGVNTVKVHYLIRDIDGTADNAIMQVALQYRIGNTGAFINIPDAYVADATTGSTATQVTAVDVTLPEAASNVEQLQLRIITSNAVGNDEWVGIDDITISGNSNPVKTFAITSSGNTSEGGPAGNVAFSFSPATSTATTFDYSFTDGITGAATFGVDYTVSVTGGATPSILSAKEGTISVPASSTVINFVITPTDDAAAEGIENIKLTVSNPTDAYIPGTSVADITITDNDAAPTVSVTPGTAVSEPSTNGNFIISLSAAAPAGGVTINYSLTGQASSTDDYTDAGAGTIIIPEGQSTGTIILSPKDDALVEGTESISIKLNTATSGYVITSSTAVLNLLDNDHPAVVINEIYGGGGNGGATFKNDFIELYNNTSSPVNLSGWSVQYSSSTGTTWQKTDLTGTIPAFSYYLVQEATGAGGTANLPTPDAAGTIAMSGISGKVALVNSISLLSGACPVNAQIVDLVGFGTANCFEGGGAATAPSNTTSIQRNASHFDSNNNAADLTASVPSPKNSVTDITPPAIVSTNPVNASTNTGTAFTATLNFNEAVEKGTGNILLKTADGNTVQTFNISATGITVSGSSVAFPVQGLAFNTNYYFEIEAGSFKDLDGNSFAGISGNSSWSFTTRDIPVGNLGTTYNFNDCTTSLSDGFSFYSVTGAQVWSCTTFGKDAANSATGSAPNGVQINGFSGTNIQNEDWLISPSYDLTGTAYPLLSFWSRTRFNGLPLQLKISTDYPGTGDPLNYTWNDLNGKFPVQTSDVWSLSGNINLAAYKGSNVYFAFVYMSSEDDGARWTVDDITVINSATPPPPAITVSATDIQFSYVASGSTSAKTFTFLANDLVSEVTLNSTGDFLLSKDGSAYSPSLTYTVTEANNAKQTVYLRFAPTAANQNSSGTVVVRTADISDTVNLKGTSIDPATTLEVVNWNVEWFGSPGFGPANNDQQEQNVKTILQNVGADIYGLVEVVDEARLARVVSNMPGYSYVIGNFGSHVNPPDVTGSPLAEAQKLAFVYKTSVFSNVTSRALINNQNTSSSSYNNWASGRYPFLMTADVTLNCVTKKMNFVLIHAKANTSPTTTSYARRQAAAVELHDTLETYFPDANVIVLGDFNDDLDRTITDGINPPVSSYKIFTGDTADFFSPTLPLSVAGKKSTVSYNDIIDHVMLTNELETYYMDGSATVLTDAASLVNNYATTTTDHYPVFTRYQFEQPAPPVVTSCPVFAPVCVATGGNYAVPSFTASTSCGSLTYSYVIRGATERSGSSNDASGQFNAGTSIITWTAKDGSGQTVSCQTTVVINSQPVVTIPDAFAMDGGAANTVYYGYSPTSSLTLQSTASNGSVPYSYLWSAGNITTSSLTVEPIATTTYTVAITDANGCTGQASKLVSVIDVRGGKKLDKVRICHKGKTLMIGTSGVAGHLAHGDKFGDCNETLSANSGAAEQKESINLENMKMLNVRVLPNPSPTHFTVVTSSSSNKLVFVIVVDATGRVVEKKTAAPNSNFSLGTKYRPGIYYAQIIQGKENRKITLIKK